MAKNKKNYELEIMISGGTDASLASSIQKARKEIDRLERQANVSSWNIRNSVAGIDALGGVSDKVFGGILKGARMAAMGTAAILGGSTMVGMGFEAQMSTVQAISQASSDDMKKLTAMAKEMGETTKFSAEEAGQGLEYMAMAGWKTKDMINGLPGIMYLAAASGEELGLVSDIVTDAMTAFGMQANESARFADVLAQASASSNTNVAMMGETFQYAAPIAGALGFSVEDTAEAIGLMANAGIKASQAGTSLRAIMTNLSGEVKICGESIGEITIATTNADGSMRELSEILADCRVAFAGLSESEQAAAAESLVGRYAMSGFLALMNAGEDDVAKLSEAIDNCTGAAQKMSEVRIDNLKGDLTLLQSAAQGAGIEIYGIFSEELRGMAQGAAESVSAFTENLREQIPTIRRELKAFGEGAREWFQPVMEFGAWCMDHQEVVKGTIAGISGALLTFKGIQVVKNGIMMLGTLSSLVGAWPVAAFGLAAGAIVGISTAVRESNKRLKKEDMSKRFGSITLSMEELDETARKIIKQDNLGKVTAMMDSRNKVRSLAEDFEEAGKTLERLNWKIGMNFGLDEGDQEEYKSAIEAMIQSSVDTVMESQYTAQLSVQVLFGTESSVGAELIQEFDAMYASINEEVQELGRQLGDAYSTALEDGVIDIDESKTIQELQRKLAEVTQQVSKAQFDARFERIADQYSGKDLDVDTFKNLQVEIGETIAERQTGLNQAAEANYASLDLLYQRGEITKEDYDVQKEKVGTQFNLQSMESKMQGLSWSTKTIADAYGEELGNILPEMSQILKKAMASAMTNGVQGEQQLADWTYAQFGSWMGTQGLNDISIQNIQSLWSEVEPQFEQLTEMKEQFERKGEELPQAFQQAFREAAEIGAVAGNMDAIYVLLDGMTQDKKYESAFNEYEKMGGKIPEALSEGIQGQTEGVRNAVGGLAAETQMELNRQFNNLSVDGMVHFNLQPDMGVLSNQARRKERLSPAHYAKGGLISEPTLSWFAEESPEMAIPLNGSRRSVELWKETGRLLGAYEKNDYNQMTSDLTAGVAEREYSSSPAPVFNLTVQMNGTGTEPERLRESVDYAFERFKELAERYDRERRRAAF